MAYTHTQGGREGKGGLKKAEKSLLFVFPRPLYPEKKSWLFSKFSPAFGVRAQTLPSLISTNCSFLPHLSPFFRYPNVILMSIQTVIPIKTSSCFHSPPTMLCIRHLRAQFLKFRDSPISQKTTHIYFKMQIFLSPSWGAPAGRGGARCSSTARSE